LVALTSAASLSGAAAAPATAAAPLRGTATELWRTMLFLLSACSEMRVSSVTKDFPHQALEMLLEQTINGTNRYMHLWERGNVPSILIDVLGQFLVVDSSLLVAHGHGVMDSIRKLFSVPWVHNQAAVQALGRARELGKDHATVTFLLASNILIGDQIHTVAGG